MSLFSLQCLSDVCGSVSPATCMNSCTLSKSACRVLCNTEYQLCQDGCKCATGKLDSADSRCQAAAQQFPLFVDDDFETITL